MTHGNKHEEREVLPGIRMSQPASEWAAAAARNAAYLGVPSEGTESEAPVVTPSEGDDIEAKEALYASQPQSEEDVLASNPLQASVTTADLPQTGRSVEFDFGTSLDLKVSDGTDQQASS